MIRFPANSNLYLDDDAVVRSDGIHEPRKDKLKTLVQKIRQAWRAQAYDEVSKLLSEHKSLKGPPAEFEELRRELPIRQYIVRLKKAKTTAENDYLAGRYSQAQKALMDLGYEPSIPAGIEGRDEIDLLNTVILNLRGKIAHSWIASVRQSIEKQIATGTMESLAQARRILGLLSELPLEPAARLTLDQELRDKIRDADFLRAVGVMRDAFRRRSWAQAVECARAVLLMDSSCEEAREISRVAGRAIRKRRVILAATAGLVALIGAGAIKAHRKQMCADFRAALTSGQYDTALRQAHRIRPYDDKASSYILFLDRVNKFKELQRAVATLPGVKSAAGWDEWQLASSRINQQAWVADPFKTEEKLTEAIAYFEKFNLGFQRLMAVEKPCRAKYEKAARIAGTRVDPQWVLYEQALASAQSDWAREGTLPSIMEQVSAADRYYDDLMCRAVIVSLNIYPPHAAVSLTLLGGANNVVFTGSPSECTNLLVLRNNYEVSIACENYHPKKWDLETKRLLPGGVTNRVDLGLVPYDGKLLIKSEVPGEIWGGAKLGNTGEWIPLSAEKAIPIEIKAPGYRSEKLTVRLSAKEAIEKSITMTLATGFLQVGVRASEREFSPFMPINGFLIVDNAEPILVFLPYTTPILPGVHEVKLSVPGFEIPKPNIEKIEIDKRTETSFSLRPINSSVVFTTSIKNSKVKIYVDGRYVGRAGEEMFLPPFVKHTICLKAARFKDQYRVVVLPKAGARHPDVWIDMGRQEDGFWKSLMYE
jgi:hypothetical protein